MTSIDRKTNFRFITVEPVMFLYIFCALVDHTVLQQLAYRKICNVEYNDTICHNLTHSQQNVVQKKTSKLIIYQSAAFTVSSICSSLVFGSWSDSIGRKAIMILPPIGAALMSVNHILNIHFFQVDVNYLLIGVIVSGLFGGFATVLSAVFSYMSDITDKTNRTLRIGILESMVFLGASTGELAAGILLDNAGFMAAYVVVLAVNICIVVYIVLVLQESYHPPEDIPFTKVLVKVHKHIKHVWSVLFKPRPDNQRMYLLVVLLGGFGVIYIMALISASIADVLCSSLKKGCNLSAIETPMTYYSIKLFLILDIAGYNDIAVLYVMKEPLNFSSTYIGYFLAEVSFLKGFGIMVLIPLMGKILKFSDPIIALVGLIISCGMFVFNGFFTSKWMMFVGAIFAIGGGIPIPVIRSMLSKWVEPSEQGSMFAGVACLETLNTIIASLIFNTVYSATVSWMPTFSLFLLGGLLLIPIIVIIWLYSSMKLRSPYRQMFDHVTNEEVSKEKTHTVQNEQMINDAAKPVDC